MAATAPLDRLSLLAEAQEEFLATTRVVDPTTPVPWCGHWRVEHLVVHLSGVHHWATTQASGSPETPLGPGPFDLPALYERCALELRETLTDLGPDAPASTLVGPGLASFWHRRQLHETLVHLWDLRTATGASTEADPLVWADTVDEVVTVMQPRQVRLGRMARLDVGIELHAQDTGDRWLLDSSTSASTAPVAGVTGPAERLALLLWGRTTADDDALRVCGERPALDAALRASLTP